MDVHVRRSGDDYAQQFLTLLPQGQAWPREPGSTLYQVCYGLSEYWGYVDGRAADLLERESDPRITFELLPDWERAWGLPDICFPAATTIAERQKMLVLYMTWLGGQSRNYFYKLMDWIGYKIDIGEYAPFMCGISRVGDTRPWPVDPVHPDYQFRWYIGAPEQRFNWFASVGEAAIIWFRCSSGQAGVDPHCRVGVPEDLQCLLNRWMPAQTFLTMDFSKLAFGGPMQGTP